MAARKCDLIHNPDEILLYVDRAAFQQMLRRKNRGMDMPFEGAIIFCDSIGNRDTLHPKMRLPRSVPIDRALSTQRNREFRGSPGTRRGRRISEPLARRASAIWSATRPAGSSLDGGVKSREAADGLWDDPIGVTIVSASDSRHCCPRKRPHL